MSTPSADLLADIAAKERAIARCVEGIAHASSRDDRRGYADQRVIFEAELRRLRREADEEAGT